MIKILFLLLSLFFISNNISAQPSGEEKKTDWPCIQVFIKELSWGSIWTGPPLNKNSSKWVDDENLSAMAKKLMNRKTKENEGIGELKKYIKKIIHQINLLNYFMLYLTQQMKFGKKELQNY